MEASELELRESITEARETFLESMIRALEKNELDKAYLSKHLETYETAAQAAVEGNLALISNAVNDTSIEAFPSKAVKWTLMQAVFFASTICTTIGQYQYTRHDYGF